MSYGMKIFLFFFREVKMWERVVRELDAGGTEDCSKACSPHFAHHWTKTKSHESRLIPNDIAKT